MKYKIHKLPFIGVLIISIVIFNGCGTGKSLHTEEYPMVDKITADNNLSNSEDTQVNPIASVTTRPIEPIIWYSDVTHDGIDEKIVVDLTYVINYPQTGEEQTVSVYSGGTGYLIWNGHADTVHPGWNGIYIYNDGKQEYLLTWRPTMYQDSADYFFDVFSLTETGEVQKLISQTLQYDMNRAVNCDTETISSYIDNVNSYLKNSYVLVDTDNGTPVYSTENNKIINCFDASGILDMIETMKNYQLKEVYYTTNGSSYALSENYLLLADRTLKVIDLEKRLSIKELQIPTALAGGFDICGTKIVWSALNSMDDYEKDVYYDETANSDIFLYDMDSDTTTQITSNTAGQINPKIWGDYIVWQDNRNDTADDMNPEWDIYLYNISTKEEKLITTAPGIHTTPCIYENKVVWEDGRNFKGDENLRWGSNVPDNNTDIYLYDISTGEEKVIANGPLQECKPFVYGNYVAYEDRNENGLAADIYLYDLTKDENIRITEDKVNQADPKIFDHYMVWIDERNGISANDVVLNGNAPNSDIFLYDIDTKEEYLLTAEEPQILPCISEHYITYITSRQVGPELNVINYR